MQTPSDLLRAGTRIHGKQWPHVGDLLLREWLQPNPCISIWVSVSPSVKWEWEVKFRRFPPAWHSQTPAPKSSTRQEKDHSCPIP